MKKKMFFIVMLIILIWGMSGVVFAESTCGDKSHVHSACPSSSWLSWETSGGKHVRYCCCGEIVKTSHSPSWGGWSSSGYRGTHSRKCNSCSITDSGSHSYGTDYGDGDNCRREYCFTCNKSWSTWYSHSGGTATCQSLATCSYCRETYGDYGSHTGGTATCYSLAVCTTCNSTYGGYAAHEYGGYVVDTPPTCTEAGIKSKHCKNFQYCRDGTNAQSIPATGHSPTDVWYGNGAGTQHYTKCSTCGANINHADHWESRSATCTTAKYCDKCSGYWGSSLGHDFATTYTQDKAPTCTETGSESQHCSRCSETQNSRSIPATGHDWDYKDDDYHECLNCGSQVAHSLSWNGNVGAGGKHYVVCSTCGYTPARNCSGGTATCTEPAKCSTCGASYGSANGHTSDGVWHKYNESQHYTKCSVCSVAFNHEGHWESSAATCIDAKFCNRCWESWGSVNPNNHASTNTTTSYPQNDESTHYVVETYDCCGAEKSRTTAGHSWNTSHKCTVCNYQGTHSWSEWIVTKEETCSAKGSEKRTCGCGGSETQDRAIDPSKHNYSIACGTCGKAQMICSYDNSHIREHQCDVTAPTVSWTDSSTVYSSGAPKIGTLTATDDMTGVRDYTFELRYDGRLIDTKTTTASTYVVNFTEGDGTYTLTGKATDNAGNTGTATPNKIFIYDTQPPTDAKLYDAKRRYINIADTTTTSFEVHAGGATDNLVGVGGYYLYVSTDGAASWNIKNEEQMTTTCTLHSDCMKAVVPITQQNCYYVVRVCPKDKIGNGNFNAALNVNDNQPDEYVYVDKKAPTVTVSDAKYPAAASITVEDTLTGIAYWGVTTGTTAPTSWNSTITTTGTALNTWYPLTFSTSATPVSFTGLTCGTYYAWAIDYAGNRTYKSFKITEGDITGSVTITGTNTYNETLTAKMNSLVPSDATLTYQWYTNTSDSTSGGSPISGATGSTYKVGSGLAGQYIYVVVTAKKANYNDKTFKDKTDASNGTATVSKAPITPVISMTGYQYATTKNNPSFISGNPGGGTVTYYYTTSNTNSNGTAWTNVTSATTLDVGTYYMYATVSETTDYKAGTSAPVKFDITNGTITGNVSISGTLIYGSTLTATVSNLVPSDSTITYQWYSNTTNSTTGGTPISGATGRTYQLDSNAFDKYVYVVATATRKNYATKGLNSNVTSSKIAQMPITVTSASDTKVYNGIALTNSNFTVSETLPFSTHYVSATPTGTITNVGTTANTLLESNVKVLNSSGDVTRFYKITRVEGTLKVTPATITGYVTITGTNTYGQTLTANTSKISPTGCNFTYHWWSSDSPTATSGTAIPDATNSSTYVIGNGLIGKYIGVTVEVDKANYIDNIFRDITDASTNGTATVEKAPITPVITMTGYQYATTKNNPSLTSGNPGNGTVTFYYNKNNSNSGGTAWTTVTSATSLDAGTYYMYATVAETTNYKAGTSATVQFTVSEGTITANLVITGKNTFDETLTAKVSSLVPSDATLTYQWWYATSATATSGTNISGANASTYKIGSGLAGKYIGVTVTATRKNYTTRYFTDITDAANNTTATVEKATGIITVSGTEYNVSKGTSVIVTYTYNGDGTITVPSSNTNVVTTTLNISESKFTFNAIAAGNITITVGAPETADYKAVSKTITVRVFDISSVANVSTNVGETATYSVSLINAYSGSTYSYQWQQKTNIGTTWSNITGATNASYSVTATEKMNGYSYRCIVKNNAGYSITSNVATLTVGWDISKNGDRSVMAYLSPDPSNTNNYIMTVTGTGTMKNFNDYPEIPWKSYENNISELIIEEGIKNLGDRVFYNLSLIKHIDIPSTVTSIGSFVFYRCTGVTDESITISKAVTHIGSNPFIYVPVKKYIVESGNSTYKAIDGVLFDINGTTLISYPAGATTSDYTVPNGVTKIGTYGCAMSQFANVTLPNTVTEIGWYAFEDSKITKITIPESVTNIGRYSFRNSTMLEEVFFRPTTITLMEHEAFYNLKKGSIIYTESKEMAGEFIAGTNYTSANTKIYYPPIITKQPSDAKSIWDATATFSIEIEEGNPTASYQWYRNGVAITGATSNIYTTPSLSAVDNGSTYYCLVSNAEYYRNRGVVTSNTVTLVVIDGRYSVTRGTEEIYYDSLQLAFDSLQDGETLSVKKNIPAESNAILTGDKSIIINTNNYSVTLENGATAEIEAGSEIIFNGAGTIKKVVNDSKAIITNKGTLIVNENIKLSNTYGYALDNTGTATLKDGEYKGLKPIHASGTVTSKIVIDGDNVKIIGEGNMTGNNGAITIEGSANLEFIKGTVTASTSASDVIGILVKGNASATITGGTVNVTSSNSINKADAIAMITTADVTIAGDVELNGSRGGVTLLDTNTGTLYISQGTIVGGQAGIFNNSNATVQVSDNNDEAVGTVIPVIRGEEFAYISMKDNSQLIFYDGILQTTGKNILYQGSVANTNNYIAPEFIEAVKADAENDNKIYIGESTNPPTYVVGHGLHLSTMEIDGRTYDVAYLRTYTAPIVNGPRNETVKLNETTEFEITVTGGVPADYTYEWQISTDGGNTWSPIENSDETKYVTPIVTADMNGNMYRCAVSNGIFTSYSREVTLTIDEDSLAQLPIDIIPIGRFKFKNGNVISQVDGDDVVELELVIKSTSPLNKLKINDKEISDLNSNILQDAGSGATIIKNSYNEIKNEVDQIAEYAYSYILTVKVNGVYTATFTDGKNHSGSVTQTIDTFKSTPLVVECLIEEPTLYRDYSVITFISNRDVKFVSPSGYAEKIKRFGKGEYANKYTLDVYGEMNDLVFTFVDKSGYTKEVSVTIGENVGKKIRLTNDAASIGSISINDAYETAQKLESEIEVNKNNKVQNVYGVSNAQVDMFMSRARDIGAAVILSNASVTKTYDAVLPKEMTSVETSSLSTYGMNAVSNEYVAAFNSSATDSTISKADYKYIDILKGSRLGLYKGFSLSGYNISNTTEPYMMMTGNTSATNIANTPGNASFRVTIINK